MTGSKALLHVEGLFVLLGCIYFYEYHQFNWLLFFALLFVPDVSMIGYVVSNKAGAFIYNVLHTYSVSLATVMCGFLLSNQAVLAVGIIWTAHIGMDRMLGYGLKYATTSKILI
ncbi:hypothetical protein PAV_3c02270 [Paenibacillus alvei DSM 29]|nr:hypothetical protein PAV_3c02270 [Paenibacillus alvei DSM 29]